MTGILATVTAPVQARPKREMPGIPGRHEFNVEVMPMQPWSVARLPALLIPSHHPRSRGELRFMKEVPVMRPYRKSARSVRSVRAQRP